MKFFGCQMELKPFDGLALFFGFIFSISIEFHARKRITLFSNEMYSFAKIKVPKKYDQANCLELKIEKKN